MILVNRTDTRRAGHDLMDDNASVRIAIQNLSLFLVRVVGDGKNLPQFERRNREEDSIPYRLDHVDR